MAPLNTSFIFTNEMNLPLGCRYDPRSRCTCTSDTYCGWESSWRSACLRSNQWKERRTRIETATSVVYFCDDFVCLSFDCQTDITSKTRAFKVFENDVSKYNSLVQSP